MVNVWGQITVKISRLLERRQKQHLQLVREKNQGLIKTKKQQQQQQKKKKVPERTINNSYHISMLQTLRLLQSLSVDNSWICRAQICQNDLQETNINIPSNKICKSSSKQNTYQCRLGFVLLSRSRFPHREFKSNLSNETILYYPQNNIVIKINEDIDVTI